MLDPMEAFLVIVLGLAALSGADFYPLPYRVILLTALPAL